MPESLEELLNSLLQLIEEALLENQHNDYEGEIQKLEAKIRKHVKVHIEALQIEIQLKLYYEHLEQKLEDEAKRYAELQKKYLKQAFKDSEHTHLKFGSQVVGTSTGTGSGQRQTSSKVKDSTSRIKSKLSFHDMAEFTRKVDIRPFAERTQLQRTIHRQPNNSLKNLRQPREKSITRRSDAEIIKQIAGGRASVRIQRQSHNSSSRNSLSSNRRSVSNSQLRHEISGGISRINLK